MTRPHQASDPNNLPHHSKKISANNYMPRYNVFPLRPPVSSAQLAACKSLRLSSLRTDPQAFGSNYAREVAFTEGLWRERIDALFKLTLIASVVDDASPPHDRNYDDGSEDDECNGGEERPETVETGEWIGTVSIIGPSGILPSVLEPFREAGIGENWEIYPLFAMWVHPAHRGKGVGARLVKGCLEWARTNVDPKFSSNGRGDIEKVAVLLVKEDNVAGNALYSREGFTYLDGVSANEGERWMLVKI